MEYVKVRTQTFERLGEIAEAARAYSAVYEDLSLPGLAPGSEEVSATWHALRASLQRQKNDQGREEVVVLNDPGRLSLDYPTCPNEKVLKTLRQYVYRMESEVLQLKACLAERDAQIKRLRRWWRRS